MQGENLNTLSLIFQYDTQCSHGCRVKRMIKGAGNMRITEGEEGQGRIYFLNSSCSPWSLW
jgi:hypothetical protein